MFRKTKVFTKPDVSIGIVTRLSDWMTEESFDFQDREKFQFVHSVRISLRTHLTTSPVGMGIILSVVKPERGTYSPKPLVAYKRKG
jgi:hypothetical protein